MLNSDALSQLSQLKQSIEDSKDVGEGIVRGTSNRFGFVSLDDGREVFLNPDEMQQVLPGDKIKVLVTENDRKKFDAKIEKLISTSLKELVGKYVIKGQNHFVQADHPQLSRWLFVPPKERKKYQSGDLVCCSITRHPFGDGKAQVKITSLIGKPSDAGIEHAYIVAKYNLSGQHSEKAQAQATEINALALTAITENYVDLRDKHFITIDAATTKDMDDALYAEIAANGWHLYVAIADTSAFITQDSPLDKEAYQRGSSAYLLGGTLGMLPENLSHDILSLLPNEDRATLVCKIHLSQNGEVNSFEFFSAIIQSKQKLSYDLVAASLDAPSSDATDSPLDPETFSLLNVLQTISQARLSYRTNHCITQQDNVDYVYHLNDQKHIESISVKSPTVAHQIVEEAMLTTNCCAGSFFAENIKKGSEVDAIFSAHAGFRTERLNEIIQLLKKDKPEITHEDLSKLPGYIDLIQKLSVEDTNESLIPTLRRLMRGAELTPEVSSHFGLGFEHYAMVTSPIRRYQDLVNHRAIKFLINSQLEASTEKKPTSKPLSSRTTEELQKNINNIRQASRQLDQWLLCEFLSQHKGSTFNARIAAVSNQGLAVRLIENGAESFISLKGKKDSAPKYDSIRMTLTYNEKTYRIDETLTVTLKKVDLENRQFELELTNQ